jgi:hypothetical protein
MVTFYQSFFFQVGELCNLRGSICFHFFVIWVLGGRRPLSLNNE